MGLIHLKMAAVQSADGFTYSIMSLSPTHQHCAESLNLLWDIGLFQYLVTIPYIGSILSKIGPGK